VFDYVVIGAGSAGCVVASRLTEDPSVSVLLLEAGGEADADEIRMPLAFPLLFKTRWDWNYETTPQKHLGDRSAYWPRMKALGGCSSMNAMMYVRGNRVDYDGWRDAYGAAGWGYDDVLPYFVRSERNSHFTDRYHGTDGPLSVENRGYNHRLPTEWVRAAVASGVAANPDFNGERQDGAGVYQVTCRKGRRASTAEAFLRPVLDRPNLTVRTGALTTRILLDGDRAIGVRYLRGGIEEDVRADGEVVLAGGAINSPQLLMLSGIGPARHLRELGIDVAVNLPGVGENLHDHPVVPMLWRTRGGIKDIGVDLATPLNMLRWQATGGGPLSSNVGEAGAFLSSRDGLPAPDLQMIVAGTGFIDNGLRDLEYRAMTVGVTLVDVKSRGTLRLRSADPSWKPEMDPAYFDDQADLDAMLAGCVRAIEIAEQPVLARFIEGGYYPARMDSSDESALRAHIARFGQTLFHPVGTCAMGTGEQAVVDERLRVHGVRSLRVADASVMPTIPRGNTNAPTIMIGEKAADLIRGVSSAVPATAAAAR